MFTVVVTPVALAVMHARPALIVCPHVMSMHTGCCPAKHDGVPTVAVAVHSRPARRARTSTALAGLGAIIMRLGCRRVGRGRPEM